MSYDDTSFYGDMIVDEYDDKCNFIGTNTPMGYLAYHLLGDGFDLMSDMCSKFMNDFNILTADSSSLDKFWGVSYNMPRPSLPYLYTVLFEDKGVTVDSNLGQWYYAPTYSSASVDESGTTFSAVREGSYATVSATLTQNPSSTDIYPYSLPLTVEFDLIEWEDNQGATWDYARIRIYNQANNKIAFWNVKDYGVGHYKIVCEEGSQILYFNGVEQSRSFTFTPTSGWNVAFQTKGKLKFKNFKVYGIVYPILFSDGGVTDNHNDNWYNQNSSFTRTRTNNATNLKITSPSANLAYFAGGSGTWASTKLYTAPFNVEFEITEITTGTPNFEIRGNNTYFTWSCSQRGSYRVEITGTRVRRYFNGTMEGSEYDMTMNEIYSIGFRQNASTEFKYRNFVIYNSESPVYSTRLLSDDEYRIYLYLRNCRLITKEDLLINFNKCFGLDDYPIVFSEENFYLEATDHLNYEPTDTVSSNLHKNSEDTTLHFVTDYSNDETTETIESGLITEEELVTVINIPYNNWDKEFLEMLEQYISIKGNIKIKEYTL